MSAAILVLSNPGSLNMSKTDRTESILVVDDSMTSRNLICRLLRQLGFQDVESFGSAASASERLGKKRFQLILTNWQMEPISGLEILKSIGSDRNLKKYQ